MTTATSATSIARMMCMLECRRSFKNCHRASNRPLAPFFACPCRPTSKTQASITKPWLAARLGQAMTQRREYIRYRGKHRKKLAKAAYEPFETEKAESGTITTTFVDGTDLTETETAQEKAQSFLTSATSFITAKGGEDGEGCPAKLRRTLRVPFCRPILNVSSRSERPQYIDVPPMSRLVMYR
ncbi:hypothetical protein B0H63DRAFT_132677 [Podospora didyma]|uniref:Uncharacterized protein n=1 Tax=Podospora didyma TaxID=330526 RepID=A0AAE0P0R8_9PEZI|nr:hypothetical protein B0H63DRAFT_132677 [Podospora didyma]